MRVLAVFILTISLTGFGWAEPPELGRQLFEKHCQTCHGTAGRGDGPTAPYLKAQPRDLTRRPYRFGCGPGAVANTLKEGIPSSGMPSFAVVLTEDEMWALAHYVRSLQRGCCND